MRQIHKKNTIDIDPKTNAESGEMLKGLGYVLIFALAFQIIFGDIRHMLHI